MHPSIIGVHSSSERSLHVSLYYMYTPRTIQNLSKWFLTHEIKKTTKVPFIKSYPHYPHTYETSTQIHNRTKRKTRRMSSESVNSDRWCLL